MKPEERFQRMVAIDLAGQRFGRLRVVDTAPRHRSVSGQAVRMWRCACDCGAIVTVAGQSLRRGRTNSCGCLNTETRRRLVIERSTKHGATAGGKRTPEYIAWRGMIQRCTDKNAEKFPIYGGRGIKVCERWATFANFLGDMGHRPSPKHQLDRRNNDGDYEPGNCRWATRIEQARNKSNNRKLALDGETFTTAEWADRLGLKVGTLESRLRMGWPLAKALQPGLSRQQPERALQRQVKQYLDVALPNDSCWTAIEHAGVSRIGGAIKKAGGVVAGIPDLVIFYRSRALFIELKSKDGRVSEEQRAFHAALLRAGIDVRICRSIDDVVNALALMGVPLSARIAA